MEGKTFTRKNGTEALVLVAIERMVSQAGGWRAGGKCVIRYVYRVGDGIGKSMSFKRS